MKNKIFRLSAIAALFILFISCSKKDSTDTAKDHNVMYKVVALRSTIVSKATYTDKDGTLKEAVINAEDVERTYTVSGVKKGFNATLKADALFISGRSVGVELYIYVDGQEKAKQIFTAQGNLQVSHTIQ